MAKKSKQDYYLSSSAVVDRIHEDVLAEILVRLPSVSVLRCQALCKRWRRITSERSFLVAHAARQPRQLILVQWMSETTTFPLSDLLQPHAQDVVEPAAATTSRRSLCDLIQHHRLELLYSLDGLVVLSSLRWLGRVHIVYNPATRQWTNLPKLKECSSSSVITCGFYLHGHGPSAEYRLLCWGVDGPESWEESELEQEDPGWEESDSDSDSDIEEEEDPSCIGYYYVLAAGGALQPRRLESTSWVWSSCYENPVSFCGALHWFAKHPLGDGATGKMLTFHTVSETFRLMSRPPLEQQQDRSMLLFEANGELGIAAVPTPQQATPLDIWVLEDYEAERWALRHRVVVPPPWDHGGALTAGMVLPVPVPASVVAATGNTSTKGGAILICFGGVASVYILHNTRDYHFRPSIHRCLVYSDSLLPHAFFGSPPFSDLATNEKLVL